MTRLVLDSSPFVAFLKAEPGVERFMRHADRALISAVNLAEVITKAIEFDLGLSIVEDTLATYAIETVPFQAGDALAAGLLRPLTRHRGLSLGDRACLALAQLRGLPVLTADRAWAGLDLGLEVRLLRD